MTEESSPLTIINFMKDVFNKNAPVHLEKPESTRWNRNYNALTEYWWYWHKAAYPLYDSHLYFDAMLLPQIELPELVLRTPEGIINA